MEKITVDLGKQKLFANGKEITGVRSFEIDYEPGHRRLIVKRIKVDESGAPVAEFGTIWEQWLEFVDDQFEIIA
jgi:hypothetical protein